MNRMLLKVTSFFLIQLLLIGSIAIAEDAAISLDKNISSKAEEHNLSPRIHINTAILNNMFIEGLPEESRPNEVKDGIQQKESLLERATEYALRKKRESQGKGILGQNIVYLLLKKRVDRLEKRSKLYRVKAKQRKKVLRNIKRLKTLLRSRTKWIKDDLAKQYEKRINNLEKLLDAVQTHGDWDDLIALGTKLNKDLLKHGVLANELNSLYGGSKLKKSALRKKKKSKKAKGSRKKFKKVQADRREEGLPQETQDKIVDAAGAERIGPVTEDRSVQERAQDQKTTGTKELNQPVDSLRKPVLERAIEKLIIAYNLAQKELPYKTALNFQEQIEQLQRRIDSMQKGQFPALKQKLRAVESSLLQAVEQQKNTKAAALQGQKAVKKTKNGNPKNHNKGIKAPVKARKQAKEKDPFAQAVTLYDPVKVKLRSIDDVTAELRGQTVLLKQIIEAQLQHTMKLRCYNPIRRTEGLVVQVNYSEVLEKVEAGSDIVMELTGEYYELKCAQILNAGSELLLKPADKDGVFPRDFPIDIRRAKFFYMPDTHSEELQQKVLDEIAMKISGKDQSTGIKVLDYLLRIRTAAQDIENIEELKESIAYTNGLDMFQKAAVNLIVKTKFGLILGPFGTGKTRVLLAGAKNLVLKSKKPVFIIAPQHKIADDITLKAVKCNIPVLRCGNNTIKFSPAVRDKYSRHSKAAQKEFISRYEKLNADDDDNGCLFVGTDLGSSFDWLVRELRNPDSAAFLKDVTLIVDEAALINYPELITAIYMLRPDALILVGDHVQFSPYKLVSKLSRKVMRLFRRKIPQKAIWRYHASSFKELIAMPFNKVKLLMNYRNPWISVDLLQKWYKGILTLQSISKERGDLVDEDTFVIEDTSTWEKQSPEEFYSGTNSYCNKTEALWILKRIKHFLDIGYSADDIAIITYYDGQIRLISELIDADGDILSADAQILKGNIFTPIRFQGAEKEIILSSLVRSKKLSNNSDENHNRKTINPLFASEPEFAKAEALLVLLSRHKGKLSLIGNRDTLDALTRQRYERINYLYSSLFSYKDRIKAYLDAQDVELTEITEANIRNYDFVQSGI